MPLPIGGPVPWPPEHCKPINAQYAIWSAWYAGDIETLTGIYAGETGGNDTTGFFASEAGGFKGTARRVYNTARRWFWGRKEKSTQPKTRVHVPIAGDIAAASADLLFSEPPTITVAKPATPAGEPAATTTVDPTQARLDALLDDGAQAVLLEAAEICAALGGVYLRVVWDPAVRPGRPWITAVHPDVAVPEWAWGDLSAVTFWREVGRKGKTVWRHLERHEPGKILHGLYEGNVDELGRVVPLADHPATAGLATDQMVNGNEIRTGATGLTAVYVPNMRPNRVWRNTPEAAYLGRSDYAGVEPLMDALDLVQSSWIRDVDLGKARLIVPKEYLESHGRGQGASVDLDREVYEPIGVMGSESGDKLQIEQVQFDIRGEEHQRAVDSLKSTIVAGAGYSAQTFGLTGEVAVTATEVAAKERRSLTTRDRKTRYWRAELPGLLETLLAVDAHLFRTPIVVQRPQVEWSDGVSVDPLAQAQTLRELHTAEAISTWMKVKTQHPDWTDPEIQVEVDRIKDDVSPPAPVDPGPALGGPPATDPGAPQE